MIFFTGFASFFAAFGFGEAFLVAVFRAALVSLLLLAVLAFVVEDLFTEAAFDFAGFGFAVFALFLSAFVSFFLFRYVATAVVEADGAQVEEWNYLDHFY